MCVQREEDPVTVFMGVPTMYTYLLSHYDGMPAAQQAAARAAAARLRLTVSGSAACPLPLMERWHALSGQRLLERYGMTETNMILSNPLRGERRPGAVGLPLPGVAVRAVEGELRVKGASVFQGYWNKAKATAEAFDDAGWFRCCFCLLLQGRSM
jgi:malonyl-CoA/methylmalonyl-CoA synthetase